MSEEKSLPPSEKRRQEARERGYVARSADLSMAAVLLGGGLVLVLMSGSIATFAKRTVAEGLAGAATLEDPAGALELGLQGGLLVLAPFALLVVLCAIAANLAQVGWAPNAGAVAPDLKRIRPAGFDGGGLLLGLLKGVLIAAVLAWTIWECRESWGVESDAAWIAQSATLLIVRIAVALVLMGVIDYARVKARHEQSLALSPGEAARELREEEGDPAIKRRRARRRAEVAASGSLRGPSRVVTDGNGLAVVLTNPGDAIVTIAHGGPARTLLRVAKRNGIDVLVDAEMAGRLARGRMAA